jgi:hypothetical protein
VNLGKKIKLSAEKVAVYKKKEWELTRKIPSGFKTKTFVALSADLIRPTAPFNGTRSRDEYFC